MENTRFCVLGHGMARVFYGRTRQDLVLEYSDCVVFPVTKEQSTRIVNNEDVDYAYQIWRSLI